MGFNIFRGRRGLPFYIYPSAFMLRRRKRRDGALLARLDNSAGLKAIELDREWENAKGERTGWGVQEKIAHL